MAKLYFKVASDWEEVVKLRNEIAKLKQELKNMDSTQSPAAFRTLNTQLAASTQRMDELVTEAAKAGTVIEGGFKKKIFDASQTVNGFTEKIIAQKAVVKDIEADVRRLGDAYRTALKRNPLSAAGKLEEYNAARKALDEEKAALFGLTQEQANARLSVKKLRDEYALFKEDSQESKESIGDLADEMKGWIAGIAGGIGIKEFIGKMVQVRGEFQAADTAIQTLLGSKEKADALMKQVREYAKISPLEFSDVTAATQMMLGFNIEAEKVPRFIKAIGDVSMGESQKFNSLTLAFSQMSATGKLMGQDLNQMINAGFNPLQQIALSTGKSIATLKEEMSKGAITTEMVQQAFVDATSAGGKFFQMSENASKTINGQLSMLQDALDAAFNEMGEKSEDIIMSGIQVSTSLIQNYETIGKVLIGMIATYGVYRTALITNIALTRSWAVAARVDAVAKGLQTIATKAQTIAQLALNSAMKANPYVLAATLIVGVATAMWAFHDSTTAAEKAQKRFNAQKEATIKKEQAHKQKLEELISTIQNEHTSSLDRVKAMDAIKANYPSLFQKYIDEKGHIRDLIGLWKEYNEEASKGRVKENKNNYASTKMLISEYQKVIDLWKKFGGDPNFHKSSLTVDEKALANKYKNETLSTLKSKLEEENKILLEYQKEVRSDELAQWQLDLKKKTDIQIKSELDEMKRIQQARKNNPHYSLNVGVGSLKGATTESEMQHRIDILESEYKIKLDENKSYKDDYEKAKKEWEDAKKKLSEIEKDKAKFTTKQYEDAKKLKETTEKAYKKLGGDIKNKDVKDANTISSQKEKITDLEKKQLTHRQRQAEDMENQLSQSKIDAMSDGFEKEQEQRKLNNKKEIQALKRQKEDYIRAYVQAQKEIFDASEELKAKQNKGYVKQTFNSSSVVVDTSKWDNIIDNAITKQGLNEWEQREASMNEYLLKYGTFTQKKEAIDKKYQDAIEKETDLGKKNMLQKEWDESLSDLDLSKLKQEINWEMIFGDLSKVTKDQLTNIKKQLQEFKKSSEFQNATPEQIQVIESAINSINDTMVDKGGFFGGLSDSLNEYEESVNKVKEAQEELEKALRSGDEAAIEKAQKKKNAAEQNQANAQIVVEKSKDKAISNITAVANAMKQLGSAEFSLSNFGTVVGGLIDALSESGSKIGGIIAAILSLLDEFGKDGGIEFGKNVVENVISAIGGTIEVPFKMLGIDLGLGGADYSGYSKMVNEYENLNKIWDDLIEKKKKYIDISYGEEAYKAGKEAEKLINKSIDSYRTLGKEILNSGASAGSHSIGVRQRDKYISSEGWNEALNSLGSASYNAIKQGRMEGLFDLSIEQLEKLKNEAPTFWAQLDDDVRGYLNSIIEGGERIGDIQKQVQEQLAATTFDNVYDNFIDTLMDMKSTAKDAAEDIGEYFFKAMLSNQIGDEYRKKLKVWYEKFASANKDGLDTSEMNDLRDEYQAMMEAAIAQRDSLAAITGYDESSSSQSTTKGFAAMSQDTGEELNGRFTALQIAGEEIKNQNIAQTQSLNLLTMKADAILSVNTETRNIADETRDLIANSYIELVQISENTGAIIKPIQQIQKDIADVKKNTEKL